MKRKPLLLAVILAALPASACGGEKPEAKAPKSTAALAVAPTTTPASTGTGPSDAPPTTATVGLDPEIQKACGISVPEAFFPFDSAKVLPDSVKILDAVVSCFNAGALKGRSLKLVGRADPRGESEYNLTLGQQRADAVLGYLATRGLDKGRQSSSSRGAMDALGTDEPSWAKDRRVDLLLAK